MYIYYEDSISSIMSLTLLKKLCIGIIIEAVELDVRMFDRSVYHSKFPEIYLIVNWIQINIEIKKGSLEPSCFLPP